jgi:hypothetical protein
MVSIATAAIAFFTWTLYKATKNLWEVAQDQSKDMKATIALAHRPKLHIHNVVVRQPRPVHAPQPMIFAPGLFVGGQFYVVNVGGRPAKITDSHCIVYWTNEGLAMQRPYEGKEPNQVTCLSGTLQPGETITGIFQSENPMGPEGNNIRSCNANWRIYVMGWIEYTDDFEVKRRTAFCREYQIRREGGGRFYPVEDPDYERED